MRNRFMQPIFTVMGLTAFLIATMPAAHAQIINGGFETPVVGNGVATFFASGASIGAWTVVGDVGTSVGLYDTHYAESNHGMSAFQAGEGSQSIDLTGPFNVGISVGVQQSVTTVSGQNYALTFSIGKAQSSTGSSVYSAPTIADLSINGGARTSFTNSNSGISGLLDWQQFTVNFTATGTNTTIAFFNGTASSNENEVGLDNVQLKPAVSSTPEPGTISIAVSMGIAAVTVFRRRRRR